MNTIVLHTQITLKNIATVNTHNTKRYNPCRFDYPDFMKNAVLQRKSFDTLLNNLKKIEDNFVL